MLNFDCTDLEMLLTSSHNFQSILVCRNAATGNKSKASTMAWFYSPHRQQMHINSRNAAENVGNVWFLGIHQDYSGLFCQTIQGMQVIFPLFFLLLLYYWSSFRDHLCCLSFCFTASTVAFTWHDSMFVARLGPQSGQQIRTSAEGDLSQSRNRRAAAKWNSSLTLSDWKIVLMKECKIGQTIHTSSR